MILLLILLLRRLKQPYFIAYILSGVLLGPHVLNIIHEVDVILELGDIGIVFLLFSVGNEIDLQYLKHNFVQPLLIALVQVLLSFICMLSIGSFTGWKFTTTILLAFVISISSSAIVFQYLARTGEIKSRLGAITCGVLLLQDILVIPMMLVLNCLSGTSVSSFQLLKVFFGAALMILFLRACVTRKMLKIPKGKEIAADHELQVFIGFSLCFGMAWLSGWFGLSTAFGAFISGILIGHDKATRWLGKSLIPFKVFFMAFFFMAVGLQLDVYFFTANALTIILISLAVLVINSFLNAMLFKVVKNSWRDSIYGGALLAQIGEFSFVLMSLAAALQLVEEFTYQLTLSVITLTMLLSTIWLMVIQGIIYTKNPHLN